MLDNLEIQGIKDFLDSLGEEKKLAMFDFALVQRAEFVAFEREGKDIAGIIGIWKAYRIFPTLFIIVKERYQGKGIGNRLIKKEIEFASKTYNFLTLSTFDNGKYDVAIYLYRKFGFQLFLKKKAKIWMCISFNSRGKIICKLLPTIYPVIKFFFDIKNLIKNK
jgi:GNAT superfamily N-acetyltransferase